MIEIDARGLSCPEPVLMVRNALKESSAGLGNNGDYSMGRGVKSMGSGADSVGSGAKSMGSAADSMGSGVNSDDMCCRVFVDNAASKENVLRFLENKGFCVSVEDNAGEYKLEAVKG